MSLFLKPSPRDAYKRTLTTWGKVALAFGIVFFYGGCVGVSELVCNALYLLTDVPVEAKEAFQAAAFFTAIGAFQLSRSTDESHENAWKGFFFLGLLMFALVAVGHFIYAFF